MYITVSILTFLRSFSSSCFFNIKIPSTNFLMISVEFHFLYLPTKIYILHTIPTSYDNVDADGAWWNKYTSLLLFMYYVHILHWSEAGVQIAYYAIIFTQFSMMVLSVLLAIGTYTVSPSLFKLLFLVKLCLACFWR